MLLDVISSVLGHVDKRGVSETIIEKNAKRPNSRLVGNPEVIARAELPTRTFQIVPFLASRIFSKLCVLGKPEYFDSPDSTRLLNEPSIVSLWLPRL
jgi:hypothetical protein